MKLPLVTGAWIRSSSWAEEPPPLGLACRISGRRDKEPNQTGRIPAAYACEQSLSAEVKAEDKERME